MERKHYQQGLACAIGCGLVWGLLPIYWNALDPIGSLVIIFYRIVLMALTCFLIVLSEKGSIRAVFGELFANRRGLWVYILSGLIITANWSIYIWAVTAGYLIQSSMGYFLEPLLVCFFGILLYKEKANKWKLTALALGVVGLLVMVIGYRQVPLIAVGLASTFAVYAAVKKRVTLPPFQSLLYETLFLAPIALIVVLFLEGNGLGALDAGGTGKFLLLFFAGLATAIPMGLFSSAANKLPLLTLGLTTYISPSISLLLGIFLFREPFDSIQLTAFSIIWIGLIFFTYGEFLDIKRDSRNGNQKAAA